MQSILRSVYESTNDKIYSTNELTCEIFLKYILQMNWHMKYSWNIFYKWIGRSSFHVILNKLHYNIYIPIVLKHLIYYLCMYIFDIGFMNCWLCYFSGSFSMALSVDRFQNYFLVWRFQFQYIFGTGFVLNEQRWYVTCDLFPAFGDLQMIYRVCFYVSFRPL